jgi:hypothetical protein
MLCFPNGDLKKGPSSKLGSSPQPHSESAHINDTDTGMMNPNVHVTYLVGTYLHDVTTVCKVPVPPINMTRNQKKISC